MKQMTTLLFLLFSTSFAFAQGGSGVGNGGKGVACYGIVGEKKQMIRVQVLDFWELRNEAHLQVNLGPAKMPYLDKIRMLIQRVARVDPSFANDLTRRLDYFLTSHEIQNRVRIKNIDDTKALVTPKGDCSQFQIAVQKKVIDEFFDKKFQIDMDAWKLMSEDDRAGLVFHEIFYWSEIERGADDSLGVRRMVGILASEAGTRLTLAQYLSVLKNYTRREGYEFNQLSLSLLEKDPLLFDERGILRKAKLLKPTQIIQSRTLNGESESRTYEASANHVYDFDENGIVQGQLQLREMTVENSMQTIHANFDQKFEIPFSQEWRLLLRSASGLRFQMPSLSITSSGQLTPSLPGSQLLISGISTPSDFDLTQLTGMRLRLSMARVQSIGFDESGRINQLIVMGNGDKPEIYDDLHSARHELTWKKEPYMVTLDLERHSILSVK